MRLELDCVSLPWVRLCVVHPSPLVVSTGATEVDHYTLSSAPFNLVHGPQSSTIDEASHSNAW